MIESFRHRGLRRFYEKGDASALRADQLKRIRRILTALGAAPRIEDVDLLPGMRLHPLRGDYAGFWAVSVSGNWRIVFRFAEGAVLDVDLVDYH